MLCAGVDAVVVEPTNMCNYKSLIQIFQKYKNENRLLLNKGTFKMFGYP